MITRMNEKESIKKLNMLIFLNQAFPEYFAFFLIRVWS